MRRSLNEQKCLKYDTIQKEKFNVDSKAEWWYDLRLKIFCQTDCRHERAEQTASVSVMSDDERPGDLTTLGDDDISSIC